MQRVGLFLALILLFAFQGAATAQDLEEGLPDRDVVAFVDVNVIPMDEERVLDHQTVIVRGDRIEAVGPVDEVTVPDEALQVDGEGRYLIPGLAEMHGHIPSPASEPAYTEKVLFLYLANGVTTVRGMLGREGQLDLRASANAGRILSPSLYLAGPPFTGGSVDSPQDAEKMVRRQKEAGWDFLKVLEGMTTEEYDAMVSAAQEADIPFVGHVPNDVGLVHVIESGQQTIDHLDGYVAYLDGDEGPVAEERLEEVVRRTREAGVRVVPTMALWETLVGTAPLERLMSYPELQYMPPDLVEEWESGHARRRSASDFDEARAEQIIQNRMRILEALHEGGVPIIFGTDAPQQFSVPGFSIHREVKRMRTAGMTPYEILRTATRNVGEYLAAMGDFGTIAAGQRADLVLLEANPLDDITRLSNRAGVMVRGRWLPEQVIQDRLRKIAASYE